MEVKGVDLSNHNSGLTIQKVKDAGYEYAILRGGYTGYGSTRTKNKDKMFETYYKEAKELGFPVGCYYYSCANTRTGGILEAEYLYKNCLKGKQFEYPIYIDIEDTHWQLDNKSGVTDAIIGFCSTLEKLGYWVGVYSNPEWFNNNIETDRLTKYTKWVARWSTKKPSFKYNAFDMWQNTATLKINGYTVDGDICYRDFPALIKARGLNGFPKPNANVVEEGDLVKITGTTYSNGVKIPLWVRLQEWYVYRVDKIDVLLDKSKNGKYSIMSFVNKNDVKIVKKHDA